MTDLQWEGDPDLNFPTQLDIEVEVAKMERDMAIHGTAFVKDGKRVDPKTVRPSTDNDPED